MPDCSLHLPLKLLAVLTQQFLSPQAGQVTTHDHSHFICSVADLGIPHLGVLAVAMGDDGFSPHSVVNVNTDSCQEWKC